MFRETLIIREKDVDIRIDVLCAQKFKNISRSRWQKHGAFFCNGVAKKNKTKTKLSETWTVSCEEETPASENLKPWNHPLTILKETADWAAIEKPNNLSVHPSSSENTNKTIVNALIHHFGKNLSENADEIDGKVVPRPGIVHRLDKTTSGVLLIAKNNQTHKELQANWKKTEKVYYAIVQGTPPKKGKIEGAIFRDLNDRKKMSVSNHPQAKPALTLFETKQLQNGFSLLRIKILTGRTHQIRVHLSSIGFPIVGDPVYGGKKAEQIFLHAYKLCFPNPKNKKEVLCIKSPLPKAFGRFFLQC